MYSRSRMNYKSSKKSFRRGSANVNGLNYSTGANFVMRGGIRLA